MNVSAAFNDRREREREREKKEKLAELL